MKKEKKIIFPSNYQAIILVLSIIVACASAQLFQAIERGFEEGVERAVENVVENVAERVLDRDYNGYGYGGYGGYGYDGYNDFYGEI